MGQSADHESVPAVLVIGGMLRSPALIRDYFQAREWRVVAIDIRTGQSARCVECYRQATLQGASGCSGSAGRRLEAAEVLVRSQAGMMVGQAIASLQREGKGQVYVCADDLGLAFGLEACLSHWERIGAVFALSPFLIDPAEIVGGHLDRRGGIGECRPITFYLGSDEVGKQETVGRARDLRDRLGAVSLHIADYGDGSAGTKPAVSQEAAHWALGQAERGMGCQPSVSLIDSICRSAASAL